MNKSQLSLSFLQAMVQSMYRYDSRLVNTPALLAGQALEDFYFTYLGSPL